MSETTQMRINVGPQHPSTHGVLRLVLDLDGEEIRKAEPVIGYLHRGMEKMAESRTYFQYLPIVDRIDYLSSFFCAEAYCQAVECLAKIEIPIKAQYIRVMLMELNRIASHLMWLGSLLLDLGAASPIFYAFEERERIIRIFENLTGARMMYNFHTFGGVKRDVPGEVLGEIRKFCEDFPARVKEYEDIITKSPIFLSRTENIGVITTQKAKAYSISGANLRASGVNVDWRKQRPYLVYRDLEFDVPTAQTGDSYARYLVRIEEMKQSLRIVEQCENWLANTNETQVNNEKLKPYLIKPETGIACSYIESSRGLINCIVYSDGSSKPVRVKWRTPSFYAVQILPKLVRHHVYADLMAIFGSLDVILPEVDR